LKEKKLRDKFIVKLDNMRDKMLVRFDTGRAKYHNDIKDINFEKEIEEEMLDLVIYTIMNDIKKKEYED